MTYIDMKSVAWEEAQHCAAFMAQGHIPREARCDWPFDLKLDGGVRRCYGYVTPDATTTDEPGFQRKYAIAVMAGMRETPLLAPDRNGSTNDEDLLAILVEGRWDGIEEFLRLRGEAIKLCKAKRYRRLAIAVYERLTEVEVLDGDELREIYEKEMQTCST
ncbi:MAG: hypothetical protein AABM42_06885 [Actinomycetota bacterium]